jgi:hypothetical protein
MRLASISENSARPTHRIKVATRRSSAIIGHLLGIDPEK